MKRIDVVKNVLGANAATASENRKRLAEAGVLAVNIVSAPGSGKTSLLEKTIPALGGLRTAVLVGDLQTTRDAERLANASARAVQINTGKGCHLTAAQVAAGFDLLDLRALDVIFIENVGNMVCPAEFDLGETRRVSLLSTTEGDDKVAKYPLLFQSADLVIINKMDLLGVVDFDINRVAADLNRINSATPVFRLSVKTGVGMNAWLDWIRANHRKGG